jgi:hypothetical protein
MRNERPSLADSIRGDLSEERARLARTQSPVRAAAWHARTAFGIAAHVMLLRIADGLREFGRGLRFDRLRGDGPTGAAHASSLALVRGDRHRGGCAELRARDDSLRAGRRRVVQAVALSRPRSTCSQ